MSYIRSKAFSTGSCVNICGQKAEDCSCKEDCMNEGTCCSDFSICNKLWKDNEGKRDECKKYSSSCELCNFSGNSGNETSKETVSSCGQCIEGLYLRQKKCVTSCIGDDRIMEINKVCLVNPKCLVSDCHECGDLKGICQRCHQGYFLYKNQCLLNCPRGMIADRISWTCLESPVNAWYFLYPAQGSCKDRCNYMLKYNKDCSCHEDCFRFATCCHDIEEYCPKLIYWK